MDDLELIFTMLGERVTIEISQREALESFIQSKKLQGEVVAWSV